MAVDKKGTKQIAANKKAWHDYFVEEKYEAGIELAGTEVKSIRLGQINLKDSYCSFKDGEIFVRGMHISPYEKGISLIRTRCACVSCLCTSVRLCVFSVRLSKMDIR